MKKECSIKQIGKGGKDDGMTKENVYQLTGKKFFKNMKQIENRA